MPRSEPGGESLRGLTGAGASRVGVEKAMRARDVSRETRGRRPGEPDRDGQPPDVSDDPSGDPSDDASAEPPAQSVGGPGSSGSSPVDS